MRVRELMTLLASVDPEAKVNLPDPQLTELEKRMASGELDDDERALVQAAMRELLVRH